MDWDDKENLELLGHVQSHRFVAEGFVNLLHTLDKFLEPRWNPKKCRWEIWRKNRYILTVQTTDGEYAPLDNRVMQKLYLIDSHRFSNEMGLIKQLRQDDETLSKKKIKEQDEYMRAISRDAAPILRNRKTISASQLWEG